MKTLYKITRLINSKLIGVAPPRRISLKEILNWKELKWRD